MQPGEDVAAEREAEEQGGALGEGAETAIVLGQEVQDFVCAGLGTDLAGTRNGRGGDRARERRGAVMPPSLPRGPTALVRPRHGLKPARRRDTRLPRQNGPNGAAHPERRAGGRAQGEAAPAASAPSQASMRSTRSPASPSGQAPTASAKPARSRAK